MSIQCKLGHASTYFQSFDPLKMIQSKWCLNHSWRSSWSFICQNFRKSYW